MALKKTPPIPVARRPRLLKERDEVRLKWREQIERGWLQGQSGEVVDGPKAMAAIKGRLTSRAKKRA